MVKDTGVPLRHYGLGLFVVIAATIVSIIPSSMVYTVRVFSYTGLPAEFAEFIRITLVIATPFAVLVTGLVRLFAVSDKEHAHLMIVAAFLEGVAMFMEVIASRITGDDLLALGGQAACVSLSVAFVFAALVIVITGSGFYKLTVANHERTIMIGNQLTTDLLTALKSPESKAAMQEAANHLIKEQVEAMTGAKVNGSNPH